MNQNDRSNSKLDLSYKENVHTPQTFLGAINNFGQRLDEIEADA